MLIDCDTCEVRGAACDGCMVHALLEIGRGVEHIDGAEAAAIEVFTRAGFEVTVLDPSVVPGRPQRRPARRTRSGRRRAA